jgi:hypothetical protein
VPEGSQKPVLFRRVRIEGTTESQIDPAIEIGCMAFSVDVQVVPEPGVEVEQPVVVEAFDVENGSSATMTTTKKEESVVTTMLPEQHDTVPEDVAAARDEQLVEEVPASDTKPDDEDEKEEEEKPPASDEAEDDEHKLPVGKEEASGHKPPAEDDHQAGSTRERLKRHRMEVAGRVWVPEKWGQETLLKDWVDCAVFDRPLVPAGLLKARRALVAESCTASRPDRTSTVTSSSAGSSPLRVHNGCSS